MIRVRKWAPLFIFLYMSFNYLWIFFWRNQGETDMLIWGSNLSQFIAPSIACVVLFHTFLSSQQRVRYFWLCLLLACLCFVIGQGIWNYHELILQEVLPVPSYADLFWLLKDICIFLAFLIRLIPLRHSFSKAQFFSDIVIIMLVAITFSWYFIIEPMMQTYNNDSMLLTISYIANPVADYGILFGALSIYLIFDNQFSGKSLILILISLFIQVFANAIYGYLIVNGSYITGSFLDPLWPLSFLLIGLSGLYASIPEHNTVKQSPLLLYKYRHFFPYFAVLILLLFTVKEYHHNFDILGYGVSIAGFLVISRLYMTLIKNEILLQNSQDLAEVLVKKNKELEDINQALSEKEIQLNDIFNNLDAVIWSFDYRTNDVMISEGVEDVFGYKRSDILKDPSAWERVVHPDDKHIVDGLDMVDNRNSLIELRIIQPNGAVKWIQVVRTFIFDERGELKKMHAVITDITEHKQAAEKIEYMAYHDELTGLPNRNLFYLKLQQEMKGASDKVAILFLDLDRFKGINDTLGHVFGDLLLQAVAKRLQACVQDCGTVSRIGGDEFTIIYPSKTIQESEELAARIIETVGKPYHIQDAELFITPSIGISFFPDHGKTEDELIKKADLAMYQAKEHGKNNYYVYTSDLEKWNDRKMKLENALRKAIDYDELELHYQPKVELATEMIVGAEALLRWKNPELGQISPAEFIPIAEETGLIHRIGEWVIHKACKQQQRWQESGIPPLTISVNVSAGQLRKGFSKKVAKIIKETCVDPSKIELEITESVMQNMSETSKILQELKTLGVHLSIDDFGKGYSSLSYLKNLPIDCVKIDKSFIDDIVSSDSNGRVMVKTIIDMGRNLHFNIVAEGIETEEQKHFLQKHQCTLGQGYLFSPPLPVDRMVSLLQKKGKSHLSSN